LSPILKFDSEDSKSSTKTSEAALLLAINVLLGSGSKGAKGESSDDYIN
jgi:hypothetical protein